MCWLQRSFSTCGIWLKLLNTSHRDLFLLVLSLVRVLETSERQRPCRYSMCSLAVGEGSWSRPWWPCREHPGAWARREPSVPAWTIEGPQGQELLWWILRSACNSGGVSPDQKWECDVGCASQRNRGKKYILPWTSASKQQRWWKCWGRGWKQGLGISVIPARLWWSGRLVVMLWPMKFLTVRRKKVNLVSKSCVSNFWTNHLRSSLAFKILEITIHALLLIFCIFQLEKENKVSWF